MAELDGTVERIGRMILEVDGATQVSDIFRINVTPSPDARESFADDPRPLLKAFLEERGHQVKDIKGDPEEIASFLQDGTSERVRKAWFHCVWDADYDCHCEWRVERY